jgi:hypothetical protein
MAATGPARTSGRPAVGLSPDRILIMNQRQATAVLRQYELYYNSHRRHRSLGQVAPLRPLPRRTTTEINDVRRRDRLGGLLHEYQQVAVGTPSFSTHRDDRLNLWASYPR